MKGSQLLKGVLASATLAVLEESDSYGYEVLLALRSRGLDSVGDASVYGTLQRLYNDGLLASYVVSSHAGPARKYYSMTSQGHAALKGDRDEWADFERIVTSILNPHDRVAS